MGASASGPKAGIVGPSRDVAEGPGADNRTRTRHVRFTLLFEILAPRRGLRRFLTINDLAQGLTLKRPMGFQGVS